MEGHTMSIIYRARSWILSVVTVFPLFGGKCTHKRECLEIKTSLDVTVFDCNKTTSHRTHFMWMAILKLELGQFRLSTECNGVIYFKSNMKLTKIAPDWKKIKKIPLNTEDGVALITNSFHIVLWIYIKCCFDSQVFSISLFFLCTQWIRWRLCAFYH